ncbi:hypothetical protein FB45DRAFT_1051211 [Roridomyces roridus]|uniref:F-box domain-containing protein n=1 Tax=Roridomyces roridus TaxID=1738132 RepID=A0AAD7CDQ5_9AGAR|nr:hypothetical protein FB45DRAFT_1051211 [Roridomyces roridus]
MDAVHSFVPPRPPVLPAAIAHLIGSNTAPDSLEERIARAYTAELESQAAFLQDVMAVCARQHAVLLQSLEAHKPILSPIRHLPNELLAEIFTVVVRDAFNSIPSWGRLPHFEHPWVLSRVCRRWATVALGTPSLWSWIPLDLDAIGIKPGGLAMTKLLHERSGNLPLSIHLSEAYRRSPIGTRRILDIVFAQCERWQTVKLYGGPESPLTHDISAVSGRLHALTTLDVFAEVDLELDTLVEINTFAIVPNLVAVRVCVEDEDGVLRRPHLKFPWHQLTRLSIALACRADTLPLLPQLSNIVELRVEWRDTSFDLPQTTTITLPHLQILEVIAQCASSPYPLSLLNFFNTPLLKHLSIDNEADEPAVLSFIKRSGCKQSLKFCYFRLHSAKPECAFALLRGMPDLLDFKFGHLEKTTVPIPFTQALHAEWLAVRCKSGGPRLFVYLRNGGHPPVDPEVSLLMQRDGFFIKYSDYLESFDSLVNSKFK